MMRETSLVTYATSSLLVCCWISFQVPPIALFDLSWMLNIFWNSSRFCRNSSGLWPRQWPSGSLPDQTRQPSPIRTQKACGNCGKHCGKHWNTSRNRLHHGSCRLCRPQTCATYLWFLVYQWFPKCRHLSQVFFSLSLEFWAPCFFLRFTPKNISHRPRGLPKGKPRGLSCQGITHTYIIHDTVAMRCFLFRVLGFSV